MNEKKMTIEGGVRVMAGVMVLIGIALAVWVNKYWLLLPMFVALNLIQSAYTGFCPPTRILKKMGFRSS